MQSSSPKCTGYATSLELSIRFTVLYERFCTKPASVFDKSGKSSIRNTHSANGCNTPWQALPYDLWRSTFLLHKALILSPLFGMVSEHPNLYLHCLNNPRLVQFNLICPLFHSILIFILTNISFSRIPLKFSNINSLHHVTLFKMKWIVSVSKSFAVKQFEEFRSMSLCTSSNRSEIKTTRSRTAHYVSIAFVSLKLNTRTESSSIPRKALWSLYCCTAPPTCALWVTSVSCSLVPYSLKWYLSMWFCVLRIIYLSTYNADAHRNT